MQCVQPTVEGYLRIAEQTSDCALYVVQAGESIGLQSVFDPLWLVANGGSELLQEMFSLGLNLVLIPFIAAYMLGELLGAVHYFDR